ncbi:MAG: toll/interleukin-1 receptor domain-containing protein [Acidobacteria bacterium]|nr:toll/interleukin-1 receptor domain-containing protein [Acidobacteriota bacterium]
MKSPSIFISYNHGDIAFVRRLTVDLQRLGVKVWVDEFEGMVGDSSVTAIESGIAASEYLGVVLSPNSMASSWVRRELEVALADEIKKDRLKVLPLFLQDCTVPLFLSSKIYADFRSAEVYQEGLAKLCQRLGVSSEQTFNLPLYEAATLIEQAARMRGVAFGPISPAALSPCGTVSFKMRLADGKGVIYCHASGPLRGQAFFVRKGIGWYYEHVLGGSASALGLPTSYEELREDGEDSPISYFEGGFMEWSPKTSIAKAVSTASGIQEVIGERIL